MTGCRPKVIVLADRIRVRWPGDTPAVSTRTAASRRRASSTRSRGSSSKRGSTSLASRICDLLGPDVNSALPSRRLTATVNVRAPRPRSCESRPTAKVRRIVWARATRRSLTIRFEPIRPWWSSVPLTHSVVWSARALELPSARDLSDSISAHRIDVVLDPGVAPCIRDSGGARRRRRRQQQHGAC